MSMCKYLVFNETFPVLFFSGWSHESIAILLGPLREVTSAGFIDEEGQAYGESVSLNIRSDPEDTILINMLLGKKDNCGK